MLGSEINITTEVQKILAAIDATEFKVRFETIDKLVTSVTIKLMK